MTFCIKARWLQGSAVCCVRWRSQIESSVLCNSCCSDGGSGRPHGERQAGRRRSDGPWCVSLCCCHLSELDDHVSGDTPWRPALTPSSWPAALVLPPTSAALRTQERKRASAPTSLCAWISNHFSSLSADSWWLVASFLEVFSARTPAHRPILLLLPPPEILSSWVVALPPDHTDWPSIFWYTPTPHPCAVKSH